MTHVIYNKQQFLELKFVKIELNLVNVIDDIKKVLTKKHRTWRTHNKPRQYVSKINKNIDKDKSELLAYLNKLAPNNYESIFNKILKIELDDNLLKYLIENVFYVATKQKMFCSIYVSLIKELQKQNDIKIFLNNYILGYKDIQEKLSNPNDKSYDSFCEKNKDKIGKAGYSQFIGELYLHDMIDKQIILETVKSLFDNLLESDSEEIMENYIICICSFIKTIFNKIDIKSSLLEKIRESYKNIKNKRLKFKLMDLEEEIST